MVAMYATMFTACSKDGNNTNNIEPENPLNPDAPTDYWTITLTANIIKNASNYSVVNITFNQDVVIDSVDWGYGTGYSYYGIDGSCYHDYEISGDYTIKLKGHNPVKEVMCNFDKIVGEMPITSLDLSQCKQLVDLDCCGKKLAVINIDGCTKIQKLVCASSPITSLNTNQCTELTYLNVNGCKKLSSLDINNCTKLKLLHFNYTLITSINLSRCVEVTEIHCPNTLLESLDISSCASLKTIDCYDNSQLTSLKANGCKKLSTIRISGCKKLTSIDVSGCVTLERLECNSYPQGQLTSLNVTDCITLTELKLNYNQLTSLDVSTCSALEALQCRNNQLTSLKVNGCVTLENLECSGNQFSENAMNTIYNTLPDRSGKGKGKIVVSRPDGNTTIAKNKNWEVGYSN